MNRFLIPCLVLLASFVSANEEAIATAKIHLAGNLKGSEEKLGETYAPRISLLPGHEFLKDQYGVAPAGARATGAEVERAKLIPAIVKAAEGRPADRMDALLETLGYAVIETAVGVFKTDGADPVGSPDGKFHFTIMEGDVLVKVAPPKGDFLLFQLRKTDGKWRVVAEYLD